MKKILTIFAFTLLMSCDKDDATVCSNEIVNVKKKQDFNGISFTATTYKNSCTNETFIVNTY